MPLEYTFAAFGIAAAVILIGGSMILRFQRDRHHFALMQAALDKGITTFPGTPPAWLVSLRIGVLSLVLGIGLVGTGVAVYVSADGIDLPPVNIPGPQQIPPPPGYNPNNPPQAAPATYRPDSRSAQFIAFDNPPDRGPGPAQGPPGQRPPGQQNFQGQGPPVRPNPPPGPQQAPVMERWHRIQNQRIIGIVAGCAGAILMLLGIVRIAFARIERSYTAQPPHAT